MNSPNLEKLRAQLKAIKNPGGDDNGFWKLSVGDHQVRLLTLPEGQIKADYHWHYGVNNKNYVCAKRSFNKDCPICDLASDIWKSYTETNDESLKELAKDLFANKRFYFPVLVRGQESEGPKIFSCGVKAAEQILEIVLDDENEDLFDAQKGFDLKVGYKLSNPNDRRTASTTIKVSRKSSPLLEGATEEELEELLASVPDFTTLFDVPDPEAIVADLDAYIGSLDTTTQDTVGTTKYSGDADEDNPVKAAFAKLAND